MVQLNQSQLVCQATSLSLTSVLCWLSTPGEEFARDVDGRSGCMIKGTVFEALCLQTSHLMTWESIERQYSFIPAVAWLATGFGAPGFRPQPQSVSWQAPAPPPAP